MEESKDSAISCLLCPENNSTCFDDFESSAVVDESSPSWDHKNLASDNYGLESIVGFGVLSDQTFLLLVEKETQHLPRDDYLKRLRCGDLKLSVRNEALDWILKAHAHYGFGPCSFFLSVNYLDRFLSVYELSRDKPWSGQLLAVACLSVAAKVEETTVPQFVDLQVGEPKFLFEAKGIQRMELVLLTTLNWKMQALTPCSFIDYFIRKITCDQNSTQALISRSVELILNINRYIDFLEFRASEIAAAVAVTVSKELQAKDIDEALTCLLTPEKVNMERILKCLKLIKDLCVTRVSPNFGSNLVPFLPQSPVRVLDASYLSSKSDELTDRSYANSPNNSPNTKRNKSNGPSDGI